MSSARQWFLDVKDVLPRQFARYMEQEFPRWKEEAALNPEDFKNQVRDFIGENIGKSASDPLSVKVYAVMDGRSEGEVYREFIEKGY